MSMRDLIAGGLKSGFAALGNLLEEVTYVSVETTIYSPGTGVVTPTEQSYSLTGLFENYRQRDIDGQQIQPHDQKFTFLQALLGVRPSVEDRLEREDGSRWQIVSVEADPAQATWVVQVRALNG